MRDYLGIGMNATIELVEKRLGGQLPDGWLDDLSRAVERAFRERLIPVPGLSRRLIGSVNNVCCLERRAVRLSGRLVLVVGLRTGVAR